MATDPQTLLTAAQCYECYTPGEWQLMKLSLLAQILIAKNPNVATDPQTLLTQAQCYNCYGMGGMWQLMELALLAQIASGGGGGGGTCVTGGNSPPAGSPPCNYSVWIQGPGPNFGVWFGDTNGWSAVAAIAQGP